MTDHGQVHVLELPTYRGSWKDATEALERWILFLKEGDTMNKEATDSWQEEFAKAYEELERISRDPERKWEYESRLIRNPNEEL